MTTGYTTTSVVTLDPHYCSVAGNPWRSLTVVTLLILGMALFPPVLSLLLLVFTNDYQQQWHEPT
jgi:hypothetical protein